MATPEQARAYFLARHACHPHVQHLVPRLVALYEWYASAGLSEKKFEAAIKSGKDVEYPHTLSEMMVAHQLHTAGFALERSPPSGGPDFIATKGSVKVQIEVYTPLPLPEVKSYLERGIGGVFTVPLTAFLMCWTKGIAEKTKKLLGDGALAGWRQKKLVDENAPFVIAINGCLFDAPMEQVSFRQHAGPLPLAAVALYAVSDPTIQFDRNTGQKLWSGFTHRKELTREKAGAIPLDTFNDPRFAPVSAVWALVLDATDLLYDAPALFPQQRHASAVLHNANALVPLGVGGLPAFEEWQMEPDLDGYAITCVRSTLPLK